MTCPRVIVHRPGDRQVLSVVTSLSLFALAGAISTVPVSITIMILLSPAPRRGALPFLIGSVAGSIRGCRPCRPSGCNSGLARAELRQDELLAQIGLVVGVLLHRLRHLPLLAQKSDGQCGRSGNSNEVPVRTPVGIRGPGPGPEPAPQGLLLAVAAGCGDQRTGTAVVSRSPAGPRLRRCHPVSRRRAHRRMAALPGTGRSAADGASTRGCSGTDRRLRRSQP